MHVWPSSSVTSPHDSLPHVSTCLPRRQRSMEAAIEPRIPPMKASVSSQVASSGRSRPRASQACLNCRGRKVKCVGLAPGKPCHSCNSLKISCVLSRHGDGRRTESREQVVALRDRLQRLESLLAEQQCSSSSNSIVVASAVREKAASPLSQQTTVSVPQHSPLEEDFQTGFEGDSDHVPVSTQLAIQHHDSVSSNQMFEHDSNEPEQPPRSGMQERRYSLPPFRKVVNAYQRPTPDSDEDCRLEMDDAHGEPICYGPTSQLYVQKSYVAPNPDHSSHNRSPSNDGELHDDAIPVMTSLIQNFFRSQHLSIMVVNEGSFYAAQKLKIRSKHYSKFLENSMLACATRMSTSPEVRRLGVRYADRAKKDIAEELGQPDISCLQGFLLLSDFESTRGRDRLGYTYCGIACRLVFDLGLAERCAALIARGKLSITEANERHTLLLATYIYDKLWSMYLGRPSAIPTSMVAAAHERMTLQGWEGPLTLEHWTGLCTDISEGTDALIISPLPDGTTNDCLRALDQRIRTRQETLPESLALDPNHIAELHPNVYGLHIQFHGARIVFHRLVLKTNSSFTYQDSSNRAECDHQETEATSQSKRIMCESAITIARLVSKYKQIYGIENIITIMLDNMYVSAAVLISYILHWQEDGIQLSAMIDWHWLHVLAEMLWEAQRHYPVTSRMRDTLAKMVSGTVLADVFDPPQTVQSPPLQPRRSSRVATSPPSSLPVVSQTSMPPLSDVTAEEDEVSEINDPFKCPFGSDIFLGNEGGMEAANVMDWVLPGLDMERDLDMAFSL